MSHHLDRAHGRMLHGLHHVSVQHLWVAKHLLQRVDGPKGKSRGCERVNPVLRAVLGKLGRQDADQTISVGNTQWV